MRAILSNVMVWTHKSEWKQKHDAHIQCASRTDPISVEQTRATLSNSLFEHLEQSAACWCCSCLPRTLFNSTARAQLKLASSQDLFLLAQRRSARLINMSVVAHTTHNQLQHHAIQTAAPGPATTAPAAAPAEPTTTTTTTSLVKPHSQHQHQLVLLIRIVARMFRKAGAVCGLLLLAKLLLGEPIFTYMLQFYSHKGNPMTLRLWKKFGSNL